MDFLLPPHNLRYSFLSSAHTQSDMNIATTAHEAAPEEFVMTSFLVGTRGSQLSLAQTNSTLGQLKSVNPTLNLRLKQSRLAGISAQSHYLL